MSYPGNSSPLRRELKQARRAETQFVVSVTQQEGPQFKLTNERVQLDIDRKSGRIKLMIEPSLASKAEQAVSKWAQEIGGLEVANSDIGKLFTLTGSADDLKKLVDKISANGSLNSQAREIILGRFKIISDKKTGHAAHAAQKETDGRNGFAR